MIPDTTIPIKETTRAKRAPYIKRLKMSMPFLSVPSRYLELPAFLDIISI